jgi:hypothetical protein
MCSRPRATRSRRSSCSTRSRSFSKQGAVQEGWEKHYPGMIEWQDPKMHGGIKGVDAKTMTVKTDLADYKANLVNVIPAQMAGKIARDAGSPTSSGFCPIKPENMKSVVDANIYVLGDASIAGDMPKSGFSANSQAKVPAMAVRGELARRAHLPGALLQHLLEPDRDRRHREGRRQLRGQGRQDRASRPSSPRPRAPTCRRKRTWPGASRLDRRRTWAGTRASLRGADILAGPACASPRWGPARPISRPASATPGSTARR